MAEAKEARSVGKRWRSFLLEAGATGGIVVYMKDSPGSGSSEQQQRPNLSVF